jgi:phosphoribosylanthranilate isomerase
MRIKICGITRREDAEEAVDAGAAALGFIFVGASPRYVPPETARSIIDQLPPFVTPVGVFANSSLDDVRSAVLLSGVRSVQLHGNEPPAFLNALSVPAYKAFQVGKAFDPSALQRYAGPAYLLDTLVEGSAGGGTGKSFDWMIAVAAKRYGRIILSGGITPGNVAEAIRIVSPYAIDVSSGVESAPGRKDKMKIRELFQRIHGPRT